MNALPDDFRLVEPERRAEVLIDIVTIEARAYGRKRPRSFSAREALICLEFEAMFVAVAAGNLAHGVALSDEDRRRLWLAHQRITVICDEVNG